MKSTDPPTNDSHEFWPTINSVEQGLRRLSSVEFPSELEGKLIATIPRCVSVAERSQTSVKYQRWIAMTAAAAVVISAIVFLYRPQQQVAQSSPSPMPRPNRAAVYITAAESKETDPCNILPPLSDWRL